MLVVAGSNKHMSSMDVASLTHKQHKHVLEDIRSLVRKLSESDKSRHINEGIKESTYKTKNNQVKKIYLLDITAVLMLIAGYNLPLEFRTAIVERAAKVDHEDVELRLRAEYELRLAEAKHRLALPSDVPLSAWQIECVRAGVTKIARTRLYEREQNRLLRSTYAWLRKGYGVRSYKLIPESSYQKVMALLQRNLKDVTDSMTFIFRNEKCLIPAIHCPKRLVVEGDWESKRKKNPQHRTCTEMSHVWGIGSSQVIGKIIANLYGHMNEHPDWIHCINVAAMPNTNDSNRNVPISLYSLDVQKGVKDRLIAMGRIDECGVPIIKGGKIQQLPLKVVSS